MSIEQSEASTSFQEAFRLAEPHCGVQTVQQEDAPQFLPGKPMAVYSDGALPSLDAVDIHPESHVTYHSVGKPDTPNLGIVQMGAKRAYDNPNEVQIYVGVQSTDPKKRTVDVQLEIDGLVASVRPLTLEGTPNASDPAIAGLLFRIVRAEGAVVTARLVTQDALLSDNIASRVLAPAKRISVAVVTTGNLFLRAAARSLEVSRVDFLTPAQFTALADAARTR